MLGNDVVDLDEACFGMPHHPRFFARVLSPKERQTAARRGLGLDGLFALFSAKEAAYKLFVKLLGRDLPLCHQSFEIRADGKWLTCPHGSCALSTTIEPGRYVHTVAFTNCPGQACVARRQSNEDESTAGRRLLMAAAAAKLGVEVERLRVVRKSNQAHWGALEPPRLFLAEVPLSLDFSLSHDGNWLAHVLAHA